MGRAASSRPTAATYMDSMARPAKDQTVLKHSWLTRAPSLEHALVHILSDAAVAEKAPDMDGASVTLAAVQLGV